MKKILIFIATLFVFVGSVKAENVTLVKDVYDNTYVYYYDRSMGKTRYLHASKYLFGNIPAYCIELGKDIASFDYTMTNSFNGINISKEDLEYIKLLSYYGYNYPGHDTDRYYMATQGLIWKRLARTSIKFTIGFNPDTFYNLTDEETAINVLVNRHNIRPSFDNANIDVIRGNETVLEDENEVLYLYYSDDDNVVIDGNKLIIKKDYDTNDNIINGKARFRIFDVNNKKYVSFKVSYPREEVIDTFDIDSNGTFMTPDVLEPGKYILYEVDTDMDGYLYNKERISFTIGEDSDMIKENDDMVLELYFYNKRVKGTLNITKYGENIKYNDDKYYYNNDILLNDVVFYLYAKEDIYENGKLIYSKDDKVNECTTNDGKCKIENIPLGNYYLKEISSSEGNVLDNTEYNISFSYKDQYTENIVYNLEVKNHLPKGNIVINKYETGTKNGISGTLIEIRNINNEIIYKGYTDKNGKIILDDMLYGKYYVSEVEASTGYRLVQDKIYFEVGDKDVDIDIYNERIKVPNTGISFDIKDIFVIVCFISSLGGILLKYKNKYIVIVGLFVIITSILYFGLKIYNYYNDIKNNDKAVEAVLNKKIDSLDNLKYRYKAVLEIPSIKLKRGILDIDNKYNKAKYNIELIKEKDDIIVLASHNGNNYNSYFGNLKNISLGDTINYYYDGKIYKYIYTDSYDIKKDGYADIYRKKGNKCIVLVTCKDGRNDGQTVFIGYLDEILEY